MILIKTEKLHSQRGKLSNEIFTSRSQDIAFEQRRFRDSFNQFTEIEPAHEHTEGSDSESQPKDESELEPEGAKLRDGSVPDVPAGASEQSREMILAIRAMWRAEGALSTADTATAMEFEKEAIAHLKAAQKGARYFTRVAAKSKPVDLKRRYLGVLDGIRSRLERVARKQESAFDKQLRGALTSVYDAARIACAVEEQGRGKAESRPGGRRVVEHSRRRRELDCRIGVEAEVTSANARRSLLRPKNKMLSGCWFKLRARCPPRSVAMNIQAQLRYLRACRPPLAQRPPLTSSCWRVLDQALGFCKARARL